MQRLPRLTLRRLRDIKRTNPVFIVPMLRISKLTDYGIVIATHLASCGEPHPVSDLSAETQIPAPTVAKVLKALAKAEVVVSQRGGDFSIVLGEDFSIGYSSHDSESVELYIEESFTVQVCAPEAAVYLTYAD